MLISQKLPQIIELNLIADENYDAAKSRELTSQMNVSISSLGSIKLNFILQALNQNYIPVTIINKQHKLRFYMGEKLNLANFIYKDQGLIELLTQLIAANEKLSQEQTKENIRNNLAHLTLEKAGLSSITQLKNNVIEYFLIPALDGQNPVKLNVKSNSSLDIMALLEQFKTSIIYNQAIKQINYKISSNYNQLQIVKEFLNNPDNLNKNTNSYHFYSKEFDKLTRQIQKEEMLKSLLLSRSKKSDTALKELDVTFS